MISLRKRSLLDRSLREPFGYPSGTLFYFTWAGETIDRTTNSLNSLSINYLIFYSFHFTFLDSLKMQNYTFAHSAPPPLSTDFCLKVPILSFLSQNLY
jgi:surface polysaccharide O-acyltransferase-like enzyme